jgi:hypothetical protein
LYADVAAMTRSIHHEHIVSTSVANARWEAPREAITVARGCQADIVASVAAS